MANDTPRDPDEMDRMLELSLLELEQGQDTDEAIPPEGFLLVDPRTLKRWSEAGRVVASGTPGVWYFRG
jgi:hypothetical protein